MNLLSASKTTQIPFQNSQLKQTALYLLQRQEENIQQKLLKQQIKQSKIKKLQEQFQVWATNKEKKIQQKLAKSEKNKFQIITKIVKKCQQSDKLYNTKIKTVFSKKRKSLKQAWKAAQKYNQQIENYQKIKHFRSTRSKIRTATEEELKNSIILADPLQNKGMQNISNIKNTSKLMEASHFNNKNMAKNDYNNFLTHSMYYPNQNANQQAKAKQKNTKVQIDIQNQQSEQQRKAYEQRYRQNLLRHQRFIETMQNKNIQDLGQRLQKIQKSRIKKDQLFKSRIKKQSYHQNTRQYEYQSQQKLNSSAKNIKKQRLKSESYTMEKRVKDWSQHTRQKRSEMLQAHIQTGNHYLYQNKIKYLKNVLAKNVALQGIQKKLYIERLKH